MKIFSTILLLVTAACVACATRQTTSQTLQTPSSSPSTSVPSPAQNSNTTVSDKSPCSLVMDQAPILNGLRLGMTAEQVLALFPGSKEDPEISRYVSGPSGPFGTSSFVIKPEKYESKEKFAGISQITFRLLDGRVSGLNVGFNGPEWNHVDKFIAKFVEGTNLPAAEGWDAYVGMDTQMKTLTCKDFEIRIFAGGPGGNLNSVQMKDLGADKTLKDRRAKAKAKPTP